jgi:hypothetical protein
MNDDDTTISIYRSLSETVMATKDKSRDALGDTGATSNFVPVEAAGNPNDWKACGGAAIAANNQSMPVQGVAVLLVNPVIWESKLIIEYKKIE